MKLIMLIIGYTNGYTNNYNCPYKQYLLWYFLTFYNNNNKYTINISIVK